MGRLDNKVAIITGGAQELVQQQLKSLLKKGQRLLC